MEIAKGGIASGSIRDLPPLKRFKFVDSDPGSAPFMPLPVKKRVFPPLPEAEAAAAAVPVCLPAKKRAIMAPPPDAVMAPCLPSKKRAYAPPEDAVMAPCLPAKKRPYAPPPQDSVAWPCVPAKKRVHAPPPRNVAAACSVPVDAAAKNRVHGPPSRKDATGSVPVCLPAKNRIHRPPPRKDTAGSVLPFEPSTKRVHPSSPREDAAGLVPVCLPSNKRVMPPLPPPSVESDGARLCAVKDVKPQGPIKQGAAATRPRLANGVEGGARGKEFKKSEKPIINPNKGVEDTVPMKPRKPRSPIKAKDLEKEACKVVGVRQCKVEASKKVVEATDAKQAACQEDFKNLADETARGRDQEAVDEDDGVLCAVCRSTDGDPSDPIVFCDGCDLMVHASCYGNPLAQAIPDGDWFCALCSAGKCKPAARPACCLCPAKGGAMKRTMEGRWAHLACALLVPEVFFRDPDGREGIDCSLVPAHRFTKNCYICESSNGCALECSQPKCIRGFHVSCGVQGGLCIEYQEGKSGAIVAGFCREHTELWEKQQLTGKYKIVARG